MHVRLPRGQQNVLLDRMFCWTRTLILGCDATHLLPFRSFLCNEKILKKNITLIPHSVFACIEREQIERGYLLVGTRVP